MKIQILNKKYFGFLPTLYAFHGDIRQVRSQSEEICVVKLDIQSEYDFQRYKYSQNFLQKIQEFFLYPSAISRIVCSFIKIIIIIIFFFTIYYKFIFFH